ncbi:MAG: aminotransferase class I/II-fold pyridoxal phosphate-dependent enzyme [Flavobacteriales bacterium]|nr:aminotransferase class I/II-fold pyridoxal phosphate-dependent enzyme [Flavobacteriales bacterium]MBK7297289.1 aminotransferase class I/II-fold pyridoxal phosphate-dependent enzyme [Flavobacteriales bacterium]MBK9535958.1 aminotransferase class I/II-fold pyridoxal phosphate-dependent enzyme [Flavobacteriales bacterium]MBP9138866.1 aminotransferase class I/II-fold pyridoxal phosphate-dependent enzyme [Flavobacteriales bacterium]HQV51772.1 GntG family PLP-dependent aldolase [Flavobacteriales b
MIDLRSDTVTKPSAAMRKAMLNAAVGDDVFGEDPTVNSLEARVAALFGHEAGLYCPSGTMTNQIAINIHTHPGDEIICDEGAHIYRYEGGGTMATSGCSVKFVPSDHGRFTAEDVAAAINDPNAQWLARTRLVNIENTCNRGGGAVWSLKEVDKIRTVCSLHGLAMHMDGARIFNALSVTKEKPEEWGKRFDTISICLSKGLGAPVGSILVGNKVLMANARRVRKRLGGGMRQAGILAAAGHYALDHHVDRLVEDHVRATTLGDAIADLPYVDHVMPVETNIIIFTLAGGREASSMLTELKGSGIIAAAFGPNMVRMVLHLDIDDTDVDRTIAVLKKLQ